MLSCSKVHSNKVHGNRRWMVLRVHVLAPARGYLPVWTKNMQTLLERLTFGQTKVSLVKRYRAQKQRGTFWRGGNLYLPQHTSKSLEAFLSKLLIKHYSVTGVKRNQWILIRSETISLNTISIILCHFCLPLPVCVCACARGGCVAASADCHRDE